MAVIFFPLFGTSVPIRANPKTRGIKRPQPASATSSLSRRRGAVGGVIVQSVVFLQLDNQLKTHLSRRRRRRRGERQQLGQAGPRPSQTRRAQGLDPQRLGPEAPSNVMRASWQPGSQPYAQRCGTQRSTILFVTGSLWRRGSLVNVLPGPRLLKVGAHSRCFARGSTSRGRFGEHASTRTYLSKPTLALRMLYQWEGGHSRKNCNSELKACAGTSARQCWKRGGRSSATLRGFPRFRYAGCRFFQHYRVITYTCSCADVKLRIDELLACLPQKLSGVQVCHVFTVACSRFRKLPLETCFLALLLRIWLTSIGLCG